MSEPIRVTIPGETPSLKNSKRIIHTAGRPHLIPSKHYQAWADHALWDLKTSPLKFHDWRYPVTIDFTFYRVSRRRFDYINLAQGPLDLLVEAGIIADDDMRHVVPGAWAWAIDKMEPRVELVIHEPQTDDPS